MIEFFAKSIFWLSFVFFFHTWFGYPLILRLASKIIRDQKYHKNLPELPEVSIIIPVYNAAGKLSEKLHNILQQDYPNEKIEIIVVSDGSTDGTIEEAKSVTSNNIFVYELSNNQGKSAAQNVGIKNASNNIIVLTDVDSRFEKSFLRKIVPYFADSRVACVGGKAFLGGTEGHISKSHGLYWRIEQFIRESESCLGILHSLSGCGFTVRKSDFVPLSPDTGDDLVIPLDMALRGKRSVMAPEAWVTDTLPSTMRGELNARQRITLRNLTGVMRRKTLLIPWRFPGMAFALWSHKVLRWLSPVFMLSMFISNLCLFFTSDSQIYVCSWYVQIAFYSFGIVGFIGLFKKNNVIIVGHIGSFLLANLGFLLGIIKYIARKQMISYSNIY